MNTHELLIDADLVRRLIQDQFPKWKDLPIHPVAIGGWDNRTFHLGDQMLVRLPSAAVYALSVEKEQKWLPVLGPSLPLPISVPLAMGQPDHGYPWKWSIYRWIEGETAASAPINNRDDFAADLAHFLKVLQSLDPTGGPLPGRHNFSRGGALATYDGETRQALALLKDKVNYDLALEIWEKALDTTWSNPPVWVHGDVSAGNLLVREGKLCAVIDFGGLAIGDPSCDLVIAWTFFKGTSRNIFRSSLPLNTDTWARAQAWALWKALIVASGLVESNAVEATHCWQTLETILTEEP